MLEQGLALNKQELGKLTSGIASCVPLCGGKKEKNKPNKNSQTKIKNSILLSNLGRIPLIGWSYIPVYSVPKVIMAYFCCMSRLERLKNCGKHFLWTKFFN